MIPGIGHLWGRKPGQDGVGEVAQPAREVAQPADEVGQPADGKSKHSPWPADARDERRRQVWAMHKDGAPNRAIAQELGVNRKTVDADVAHMRRELEPTITELAHKHIAELEAEVNAHNAGLAGITLDDRQLLTERHRARRLVLDWARTMTPPPPAQPTPPDVGGQLVVVEVKDGQAAQFPDGMPVYDVPEDVDAMQPNPPEPPDDAP